jgi:hypothetical protein
MIIVEGQCSDGGILLSGHIRLVQIAVDPSMLIPEEFGFVTTREHCPSYHFEHLTYTS